MSLRFAFLGALAALIALPVSGCLGSAFTTGSGGGATTGDGGVSCASGQTTCSGACVDTQTDSKNCGTCGTKCDPGASCAAGKCKCPGTRADCGATAGCVD